MAKKKEEFEVVDGVKYEKGKAPKSRAEMKSAKTLPEEGGENTGTDKNPPIRRDIQAGDYEPSMASAKRKADNAKNS